jgi:hypothetical protein
MSRPDRTITEPVTIGAGASLSGASSKFNGYGLVGILTASTWDAAKLTFEGSNDGTNFFKIVTNAAEYEVASVTGAACIAVDPNVFVAWDYIKVRSGTSASAVNQADETIVTLVFKL